MIPGKTLVRVALLACTLMFSQVSLADPVRCSPGYQDSTCTPALSNAPQAQPQCPNSAGWTTAAGSTWIGSRWTPPTCNYQAEPTCPPGTTASAAPVWNGASWVGLSCQPSIPPTDPLTICTAQLSGFQYSQASLDAYAANEISISAPGPFKQTDGWQNWSSVGWHNPGYPGSITGYPNDTAYYSDVTGPGYMEGQACRAQNAYISFCMVNAAGNVDFLGVYVNGTNNGQCNH